MWEAVSAVSVRFGKPREQRFEDRTLAFEDLHQSFCWFEPGGTVGFRKFRRPTRPRRPFHRKAVASECAQIELAFDRKRVNAFAARLLEYAELDGQALRQLSRLLLELARRGCK